ncbi:DNA mismatch repair protein [Nowakowskiella sp. JEL0407]|nr:DNA mismatch repair protein [Nowakowskiella sp. JEL0407]
MEKLPVEVIQQLRSTVSITSLSACVRELLHNSIDAGASVIHVSLGANCTLIVEDNGSGIPFQDFHILGERYATTKFTKLIKNVVAKPKTFGFRGEAISSIAELACIEITSRSNSIEAYTKIIRGSKVQYCGISLNSRSPGTTVTVSELFFKYPVRQKQLLASDCVDEIRKEVESIALISPPISFTLTDLVNNKRIIQTRKASSELSTFKQLYGVSPTINFRNLDGVDDENGIQIHGFVSIDAFPSKLHQHVYFDRRKIAPNLIHATVNRFFQTQNQVELQRSSNKRVKTGDKYPIFFLSVTFSDQNDIGNIALKDLSNQDPVIVLLERLLQGDDKPTNDSIPSTNIYPIVKTTSKLDLEKNRPLSFEQFVPIKSAKEISFDFQQYGSQDNPRTLESHYLLMESGIMNERRKSKFLKSKYQVNPEVKQKVENLLKNWQNPVFELPPAPIPTPNSAFQEKSTIPKSALSSLTVIGQIDKKFIACLLPSLSSTSTQKSFLVIDQHAADERIRLEELIKTHNTSPDIVEFDPPVEVILDIYDTTLVEKHERVFQDRGIFLSVGVGKSGGKVVFVRRVPSVIASRCGGEFLKGLVKQHAHWIEMNRKSVKCGSSNIPKPIFDIFCSKACRSAIMFGDKLTNLECESLIKGLENCDFPFQCAHGRPSMAVLSSIETRKKPKWYKTDLSRFEK